MAKKEKDLKQEKPTKETKKCARCGAELVEDKKECTVCFAPTNWEN